MIEQIGYPEIHFRTQNVESLYGNKYQMIEKHINLVENQNYLSINLPEHSYTKMRYVTIPFNPYESNNSRFQNLDEAMNFIAIHCYRNHGVFNFNLAKVYLDYCQIFNIFTGKYEQLFNIDQGVVKNAYHKAKQNHINMEYI